MEKAKKSYNRAIGTLVLLFVVLLCALSAYSSHLRVEITRSSYEGVERMLAQQSESFVARIESDLRSVKNCARTISQLDGKAEALVYLTELAGKTNFEQILLIGRDGHGLLANGETVDLSRSSCYAALMQGQHGLFPPMDDPEGETFLPIGMPIYVGEEVKGALLVGYGATQLSQLLPAAYEGSSAFYITDTSGNILASSGTETQVFAMNKGENIISALAQTRYLSQDDSKTLAKRLRHSEQGRASFDFEGETQLLCYQPLPLRNWTAFMQVPEEMIAGQSQELIRRSFLLAISVLMIFFHLVAYVLWEQGGSKRERERHAEQLEHLAYYDALTGLPNLRQFKRLAEQRLRKGGNGFLLLKLDIINFKVINAIFGFTLADRVLKLLAQHLAPSGTESKRLVARVNGDEFLLLQHLGPNAQEEAEAIIEAQADFYIKVRSLLGAHRIELRSGRYLIAPGEQGIEELIERVNRAHYSLRARKGARLGDYDESMREGALHDLALAGKMNQALEQGAFQVYLQPKILLETECIVGAEALVRWQEGEGEALLEPANFLPLFERNGFVTKLDLYMYEEACKLLHTWIEKDLPLIPISLNFSRLHLTNELLCEELSEIAERYGVPKQYIMIELTESAIYEHEMALEALLLKLHAAGFGVSMDDFGTGYSSLGLLKNLRVDEIKIDSGFFDGEQNSLRAKKVLRSVMSMAKRLGIVTVVEGVETRVQADFLRSAGCDMAQGYYYAIPVPAAEFRDRFVIAARQVEMEEAADFAKLGDMARGRETLGKRLPLAFYHLLRSTVRRELTSRYGTGEMMETLRESGVSAGRALAQEKLDTKLTREEFIPHLLIELGRAKMGDWELEWRDECGSSLILRTINQLIGDVNEDEEARFCQYEEGILAGIFYEYSGKEYLVRELSCRCNGAHHCRFELREK